MVALPRNSSISSGRWRRAVPRAGSASRSGIAFSADDRPKYRSAVGGQHVGQHAAEHDFGVLQHHEAMKVEDVFLTCRCQYEQFVPLTVSLCLTVVDTTQATGLFDTPSYGDRIFTSST